MADRWQILYEDGRTFSSRDGRWIDAPATGVRRVTITRERVSRVGRTIRDYTRLLHGFGSYYFRILADGSWEFGCHADLTATTSVLPNGERVVWAPDAEEQVFDQPTLPVWATGDAVKTASRTVSGWPWERGLS